MIYDAKIAETFNLFLDNIVNTLITEKDKSIFCDTEDKTDPSLRTVKTIANILAL